MSVDAHPLLTDELPSTTARPARTPRGATEAFAGLASLQVAAVALVAVGLLTLGVGWLGVSDKVEVWEQLPYLISGGFGGAALVGLGVTAFLANEHREDRLRTAELLERVERRMDELEMAIAAELDELPSRVAAAPKSRARS